MDNNYTYEEVAEDEGLTFKKIGYFFKKGWLMMVVCIVAALVLTTVIALPIKFFYKTEPIGKTSIEYIYDGVEEGKDPNGGTLNTDNIISTTVLKRAIENAELGDVIKDVSTLRAAMRVEGVPTEEYVKLTEAAANGDTNAINTLRNYNMFPTRFDIIISEPKENKLGLTDTQTKNLLNEIVKSYYESFKDRFSMNQVFSTDTYNLSGNTLLEFTDIYDVYSQTLVPIESVLKKLNDEAPTFISAKQQKTFDGLMSDLKALRLNYTMFNNYILTNSIWVDKATAKTSIDQDITRVTYEITNLESNITALKKQIEDYQPESVKTTVEPNGGQTIVANYGPVYESLQEELREKNNTLQTYKNQLAALNERKNKIDETSTGTVEQARANLVSLEEKTVNYIEKANGVINDYYETSFIAGSVRQVQPPVVTRESAKFSIVIVYIVAVLVGFIVGAIIAGVSIAKSKAKKEAAKENAEPQNK